MTAPVPSRPTTNRPYYLASPKDSEAVILGFPGMKPIETPQSWYYGNITYQNICTTLGNIVRLQRPLSETYKRAGNHESAFEKDSQGGFGVIHRASDQRREPTPDAEDEAASAAALRHRSDRRPMGFDLAHDPGCTGRWPAPEGDLARADQRDPLLSAGGRRMAFAAA